MARPDGLSDRRGHIGCSLCVVRKDVVWAKRENADANLVRIFVRNLRQKLGDSAASPDYLFNERGVGYRMPRPGGE